LGFAKDFALRKQNKIKLLRVGNGNGPFGSSFSLYYSILILKPRASFPCEGTERWLRILWLVKKEI